jgi:hypothetical protein
MPDFKSLKSQLEKHATERGGELSGDASSGVDAGVKDQTAQGVLAMSGLPVNKNIKGWIEPYANQSTFAVDVSGISEDEAKAYAEALGKKIGREVNVSSHLGHGVKTYTLEMDTEAFQNYAIAQGNLARSMGTKKAAAAPVVGDDNFVGPLSVEQEDAVAETKAKAAKAQEEKVAFEARLEEERKAGVTYGTQVSKLADGRYLIEDRQPGSRKSEVVESVELDRELAERGFSEKGQQQLRARADQEFEEFDAKGREILGLKPKVAQKEQTTETEQKTLDGTKRESKEPAAPVVVRKPKGDVTLSPEAEKFAQVCRNMIGDKALEDVYKTNAYIRENYGSLESYKASVAADKDFTGAKKEAFGKYHAISQKRMEALHVSNVKMNGEGMDAATLAGAAGIGNVKELLKQDKKGGINDEVAGKAADAVKHIAGLSGIKVQDKLEVTYDVTAPSTGAKAKEGFQIGG